ncbi:MAG: DUF1273 family protein [Clostridia bacterium]|nr:DUF1273 family protein [Clostridia bacterium]
MFFKNKRKINILKSKCENIYEDLKQTTLCFTGHRCQKLPWKFNESDERCEEMKSKTKQQIKKSIEYGYTHFISGMAIGFDMICAETILELKKEYPHIKLVCAIPCKNQDKLWSEEYKKRYRKILNNADIIRYIAEEYTNTCMQERNDYMLKNSSKVIALFNGVPGGTQSTILKAKKMGLTVDIIDV